MRREPESFGDEELELVLVARKLKEALAVEELLAARGFDYVVEPGRYQGRALLVFPTERIGAFFYVPVERTTEVRALLTEHRHQVVETEDASRA
jgi:hypothetical protein